MHSTWTLMVVAMALACASVPKAGPLAEGSTATPRISAVDTTKPPKSAWIQLDQPAYVALMLVAPGRSATLLYPSDSTVDNHLSAGAHQLNFRVPGMLVITDTTRAADRRDQQRDTSVLFPGRTDPTRGTSRTAAVVAPNTPVFLLLVTSPQPLVFRRIVEKTAGVSIPSAEMEALNAVAKAVKSTLTVEPREWAGYYQQIDLGQRR